MPTGRGDSLGAALRSLIAAHGGQKATYTAKGWHAQLRALGDTQAGRDAADRAGLAPTSRTYLRWLAEEQTPSPANRAKIQQAYARAGRHPLPETMKVNINIRGKVGFGDDVRDRGANSTQDLLIGDHYGADWDDFAEAWEEGLDDERLEAAFIEHCVVPDLDTSDDVSFPGGAYTVSN